MDDALRSQIQDLVQHGDLPGVDCAATWFGSGRGERCGACQRRILGSEVAVECDVPAGGMVVFHAQCYDIWHSLVTPRA